MTPVPTDPLVSIVVPCRNEARYIGPCLDSILGTAYPADRFEVLVADGMSADGTREVVERHAARHPAIRLLENPGKSAPAGLNRAIAVARGEIIVRMDAHVVYPPDYLPALVTGLLESGADNVGGVIETRPGDDTPVAHAIALALSHPFGVGNSYFRIGARVARWVDTVPFGCFRRDVFARVGLFDEELVRNQDEELNHRLLRRGGRVLLLPHVVSYYYARASLADVRRMFFQYGYYKPLVARRVGAVMTLRQLVPAALVLSLAGCAVLAPWVPLLALLGAGILGLYAGAVLACAVAGARRVGMRAACWLLVAFPLIHWSYGLGFLKRLLEWATRRRRVPVTQAREAPLSRSA